MENIKVNETPVRTSRNFNINNLKLDVDVKNNLKEFKNVKITTDNALISEDVENSKLTYGNGEVLEQNVYSESNSKIKIVADKKSNVVIDYNLDYDLVNNIEVIANKDIYLIVIYRGNDESKLFRNGIIRVEAKNGSNVDIEIVNLLNSKSQNFEAIEVTQSQDSNVNVTVIDLGGKESVINYFANVLGDNAKNNISSLYIGKDNEVKDINYIVHLKGKKTKININVEGALLDSAIKHFKGTIDFKKGAKGAKGDENEYAMLLSPKAKSLALPMLLCTEEDVEGNHASASGEVDKDILFYIMTRGFDRKEAIKLIVRARFNKIIDSINDEKLKEEILDVIDRRLD